MHNITSRIRELSHEFSGRSLEVYSAWTLVLFGVALLWPGDTFGRPWYGHMANAAPENTWGAGMVVFGCMQGLAVAVCHSTGAYWCRTIACAISCAIWGYISLPLILNTPPAAGAVPYFTLAVAMSFVIARGRPT